MISKLFWMIVGGGVALWGRKRAVDEVDKRLPKPAQRFFKNQVLAPFKRFAKDVSLKERRMHLERELDDLENETRQPRS